jgi:predicted helicase
VTATIYEVLDDLRRSSTDEREKGDRFERLMAAYLRTDPMYAAKFSDVWLWSDWPDRRGKPDTGIDLVARERETGDLCAIQCKFYSPDHTLQKEHIDPFFTASGKAGFTSRMVISTTDKWSKNAEDALEDQQIPVMRLRVQDLDDSPIDWSTFSVTQPEAISRRPNKTIRAHQQVALEKVMAGLSKSDRGKLIMACGTGKTFAALKIAERLVPPDGSVLYLVPSISLLSQSLKEWSSEAEVSLRIFAVCSDPRVGKRTKSEDIGTYDLAFPASTDSARLHTLATAPHSPDSLTVVFSTYQSIQAISDAQKLGLPDFDLIICDEAHRTTGVTLADEDESYFVKVHDDTFIHTRKRLYMTATPRIYDDSSKVEAAERDAAVCSMDDEALFGPELHRLGFGEAVEAGLLSDYKVLVLAVDEAYVSKVFQSQLADINHELRLDDAAKIVGCWNGLSKRGVSEETFIHDPRPMRRAVAFARSIRDSKRIAMMFTEIVDRYISMSSEGRLLRCEAEHVDGTFNALRRNEKLDWLKEETGSASAVCRVLSNARCLSEGVDVPALDAVMFLSARNSIVDVVQSVGRVMRKVEDKEYGYVILPIGVPADLTPEEALRDNQKYRVVWQVLQALRAHDDRFNAMVNKIDLNKARDDKLQVIGVGGEDEAEGQEGLPAQLVLPHIEEWRDAIYAKIVQKVGDRRYWEDWAKDVAAIADRHATRIRAVLSDPSLGVAPLFDDFLQGLRSSLNDSISADDAIDMLSQHLITKPVFDALFEDYAFAQHNPVSIVMQSMADALGEQGLDKETEGLERFYDSVRRRAEGIDNAEGRQRIILELYERFFKTALPKATDRLGIVYTPVEIVDFIIRSVEAVLRKEFGTGLDGAGVHVLDPFTGTGTFIVRLLQSGLIAESDLRHKYDTELHANETVLLAYYIAAINIEAAYHGVQRGGYEPFEGIVLTDTFQMFESADSLDEVFFPANDARVKRQRDAPIRVILGNPPYSVGQGSQNDANRNVKYSSLDAAIEASYAGRSSASLKRNLYDSYVRAFRWASNRINGRGIICFVSNGAFIDTGSFDGFRKTLAEEFDSIYCFNLRGNQRTSGETSRREGGKIFGQGSRTPIAITLLVKNPDAKQPCEIWYYDIGDYLSREEKLMKVAAYGDVLSVPWERIAPNESGDWINQRNPEFAAFQPMGSKKKSDEQPIFEAYSLGVITNRDAWACGFSRAQVFSSMGRMVEFYNEQVDAWESWKMSHADATADDFLEEDVRRLDPKHISWTRGLKGDLRKGKRATSNEKALVRSLYRPFSKHWLYFDRQLNEVVSLIPKLFPTPGHANLVITTGIGAGAGFCALITDLIPDLHIMGTGQCFPLYHYSKPTEEEALFADDYRSGGFVRHDAITDATLELYVKRYGDHVTKEDIFYYVYALLHSPEYKQRFAADLRKMIPRVLMAPDFDAFASAGRQLAHWHLAYETVDPFPLDGLEAGGLADSQRRVVKMRFAKARGVEDKTTIIFNSHITLAGIPLEAYDYDVNGKSAIEWVMDRYQISTDKASGILNDPNAWSQDQRYILDLVGRVVRVSLESRSIIAKLPSISLHDR